MSVEHNLWRLRIDVFAPSPNAHVGEDYQRAVREKVTRDSGQSEFPGVAFDAGTGVAGKPVIGTLFWVSAKTAGEAVDRGIALLFEAYREAFGEEAALYDVTAIPKAAVVLSDDPRYPDMPD